MGRPRRDLSVGRLAFWAPAPVMLASAPHAGLPCPVAVARQLSPAPAGARITVLNAALADQIAAGEVVERPASVVKELVENAVDAGATRVDVELVDGGLTAIRVIDNGAGIHPEDLPVAIMRHGTSKVRGPEDLVDIQTLGFRGEALASMAAVAHLSLRSRQRDAAVGAEIRTVPGETPKPSPVGMPTGTQVEIRGLFANVPARRKFMRSEATEVGHCSETLLRIALVNPTVHLTLRHGRRELLNLAAGTLDVRVAQVLERRASGPFFAFSGEEDQIHLSGWLADPTRGSGGRSGLYIVTRRRVVRERNISQILGQALGEALQAKSPIGCLIVEPPPATVDVNVHPQKSEIRFSDPQRVYAAVRRILAEELPRAPWSPGGLSVTEDMSSGGGRASPSDVPPELPSEMGAASATGEAIGRWAATRPEPEALSVRGPEASSPRGGASASRRGGAGPTAAGSHVPRGAGPRTDSGPALGERRAVADQARARASSGATASPAVTASDAGPAARPASAAQDAGPAATGGGGPGRGYRLSTRALDLGYSAHKREVRAAASELRGTREFEVPIQMDPPRRGIGPLFAGVAMPVDEEIDVEEAEEAEEAECGQGAERPLPRLLTCLPGPVAIYLDPASAGDEPSEATLLAIDLRALRSHLVFRRLMRDLKASRALAVQGLLQPVVVRRPADDVRLCADAKQELLDLGVDLDAFGDDAVVVRGVPAHLRSCLDDADVTDLIARVIPWLRLRSSDRQRAEPQALLTAIAATAGAHDPAPRLAKRWIAELVEGGESLDEVPGVRRWTASTLLGGGG